MYFIGHLLLPQCTLPLFEARRAPFEAPLTRLDTVHGIARRTAEVSIAEIGVDMTVFPSDHHLASGAGRCPGNHESAGKHTSGKTRQGDRWLRPALVEAAAAAIRTKDSALAARYRRGMRHRGHKKAVVAVGHAMLRAVYHVLADGTPYRDPGPDDSDRRHAQRVTRRAIELLERQGYLLAGSVLICRVGVFCPPHYEPTSARAFLIQFSTQC